jgi:hypothetical protein
MMMTLVSIRSLHFAQNKLSIEKRGDQKVISLVHKLYSPDASSDQDEELEDVCYDIEYVDLVDAGWRAVCTTGCYAIDDWC